MGNPDFSNRSTTELKNLMHQYVTDSPPYKAVADELSKRETKINEIPSLPDDVLKAHLSIPDVPDPRGIGFPPVNDAEKIAIAAELRRRETEKNIKAIQSDIQKSTIPHWTRNWTFYLVVVSILIALGALFLQWKSYIRDSQSSGLRSQSIVDGIQWEMGIAEAQCSSFLLEEVKMTKELGSPAWIAQTSQIQNGLSSGIFDENLNATAALQRLLTDLISLNERNRLMANAAVDNLPEANKTSFLKDNLRRYGENCSSVIKDIKFGRTIILNQAKTKGLKADLIDFGKIDPFPPRSRATKVSKHD